MKEKILRAIGGVAIVALIVFLGSLMTSKKEGAAKIITTNFVGYDFARAVTGEEAEVAMLLKPGAEMHDFEPTPEDIIRIKNADLFIYNGGESEEWVERVLKDNEVSEGKTLRLMDLVDLKEEESSEGMESEPGDDDSAEEYDEHIWTSPVNAKKMVGGILEKLVEIYPEREGELRRNYAEYVGDLNEIDREFREVVAEGTGKALIFGDRFPFRYFTDEYGLDYFAAFPGCAEQTEASSGTIAFLIDKAREEGVRVILKTELTSDKLAKTIAEEVGAKVMELYAMHNVSQDDFNRGVTYVDMMRKNVETLREALR